MTAREEERERDLKRLLDRETGSACLEPRSVSRRSQGGKKTGGTREQESSSHADLKASLLELWRL